MIKGYEQTDYGETFAPVAKLVSFRAMMALAARHGWEVDQMDVVTAFLNPPVKGEIYMQVPEGVSGKEGRVCRLRKALYGLKEAPRLWHEHIDKFLGTLKFERSENDPNLYILQPSASDPVHILLYVDDLLIASRSRTEID